MSGLPLTWPTELGPRPGYTESGHTELAIPNRAIRNLSARRPIEPGQSNWADRTGLVESCQSTGRYGELGDTELSHTEFERTSPQM